MLPSSLYEVIFPFLLLHPPLVRGIPLQEPLLHPSLLSSSNTNISQDLFNDLEQLSRIVDISYCVGATGLGIAKPFECASRCSDPDFAGFELVTTWNTGVLLSDSCGYMVLSHPPGPPRIILAFRGTYSVANTIVDLSTVPQEYVPYPGDEEDEDSKDSQENSGSRHSKRAINPLKAECTNCTVHAGFMSAWRETRPYLLPHLQRLLAKHPSYRLTLVGHSLGGAIAALAALDFHSRGWNPQITTFGEPRVGNAGLMKYLDAAFFPESDGDRERNISDAYRRVTHNNDPVPLLPLTEWGYEMHAGEIYISNPSLPPRVQDLRFCEGDEDPRCIAGAETVAQREGPTLPVREQLADMQKLKEWMVQTRGLLEVPPRWRIWQLFFAHRDYFWRLGLCVPSVGGGGWFGGGVGNGTEGVDGEL